MKPLANSVWTSGLTQEQTVYANLDVEKEHVFVTRIACILRPRPYGVYSDRETPIPKPVITHISIHINTTYRQYTHTRLAFIYLCMFFFFF